MKKTAVLLLCAALLLGAAACARTEAPQTGSQTMEPAPAAPPAENTPEPAPAEPGAEAEPTPDSGRDRYDIDLSLDADAQRLTETVVLTLTNRSADVWTELCLRDYAASILLDDASRGGTAPGENGVAAIADADGAPLSFTVSEADASVIRVALNAPLEPGAQTAITIEYTTYVPMGGYRLACFPLGDDPDMTTYELGQFYPVLAMYENGAWDESPYFLDGECFYSACCDFTVSVTVPGGFIVTAGGHVEAQSPTQYEVTAEDQRDLCLLISSEYASLSDEVCGVTVTSWFCAGSPEDEAQGVASLAAALDAVAAYTEAFGPCAFDELNVAESNYEFGGMETPGLVRISQMYSWDLSSGGEETRQAALKSLNTDVAHELAHEWFYAAVGNDQYAEAWLDEGFASYAELVYERYTGADEASVAAEIEALLAECEESYTGPIDLPFDAFENELQYVKAVYRRGRLFLCELEQTMGTDAFRSFLQGWYTANAGSVVHTADFLAALRADPAYSEAVEAVAARYLAAAAA